MEKSRTNYAATLLAIVLLLLPVLYVGSYCVFVEPSGIDVPLSKRGFTQRVHYRIGTHPWASYLFWPLEQIDRSVRPGAWEPRRLKLGLQPQGSTFLIPPQGK